MSAFPQLFHGNPEQEPISLPQLLILCLASNGAESSTGSGTSMYYNGFYIESDHFLLNWHICDSGVQFSRPEGPHPKCGVVYLINSPEWLNNHGMEGLQNHHKSLQTPFSLSCTVQGSVKAKVYSAHGFIGHKAWEVLAQLAVRIWPNAPNNHNTQYNTQSLAHPPNISR